MLASSYKKQQIQQAPVIAIWALKVNKSNYKLKSWELKLNS